MPRSAVVVGSGPNGLAAAITLARAGLDVLVHEAADSAGGGLRSAELTLPGFVHDVCSSIHPMGRASPFFRQLDLDVEWVDPPAAAAHPFDDGTAVTLERGVEETAAQLGEDADAYRRLVGPLVRGWKEIEPVLVGPHPPAARALLELAGALGLVPALASASAALLSARALVEARFAGTRAQAFLAGHAAHSMLPLERRPSGGFALALAVMGHALSWSFPRGGAQRLADALAAELRRLGGEIRTSSLVEELPRADVVMADVAPRGLLRLAGERLPERYARQLRRFRYGPGAFKLDWALSGPIPWTAEACRRAGTVHLGGTLDEISASEWARSTRSPRRSGRPGAAGRGRRRSCCSRSTRCSTRHGRPRVSTRRGPTATFRTAGPAT